MRTEDHNPETVEAIVSDLRQWIDDCLAYEGRDILKRQLQLFARRLEMADRARRNSERKS